MGNTWINREGEAVDPRAPRGSGGCGSFCSSQSLGRDYQVDSRVPHPDSPVGRHLVLSHNQKRHLKANSSAKPAVDEYAEVHGVLYAIASILNDGEMPASVPPKYSDALQELSDAREDRTDGRLQRFEHAVKRLAPALKAADASHLLYSIKERLKIEGLIMTWRNICSWGPATLPTPIGHEQFEYTYFAQQGETIAQVARKFGYDDPYPLTHPVYGYALNMRLRLGDQIHIPFSPKRLKRYIEVSERLIEDAKQQLVEAINWQRKNVDKEELEDLLVTVEAIAIVANMAKAAKEGIQIGLKGMKILTASSHAMEEHCGEKMTEEMLEWGLDEGVKTNQELFNLALESSHAHKRGLVLFVRHMPIGWLSLTYWFSLVAALKSGEVEVFLYGPEGIEEKRCEELAKEMRRHIDELKEKIDWIKMQLSSRIYVRRVKQP